MPEMDDRERASHRRKEPVSRSVRSLAGAVWALYATCGAWYQLRHRPLVRVRLVAPWTRGGDRAVTLVLRLCRARCLVRALVLQEFHRRNGRDLTLVIGVPPTLDHFEAHAWLEDPADGGALPAALRSYTPILRLPRSSRPG